MSGLGAKTTTSTVGVGRSGWPDKFRPSVSACQFYRRSIRCLSDVILSMMTFFA